MKGNHEAGDGGGGVPFRRRRRPLRRRDAAAKLNLNAETAGTSVVPMRVRVEVHGGRHSTASLMRAYRVLQQIEGTGGTASIIEVATDGSTLEAEVDSAQAANLARLPFVRRIVSLN